MRYHKLIPVLATAVAAVIAGCGSASSSSSHSAAGAQAASTSSSAASTSAAAGGSSPYGASTSSAAAPAAPTAALITTKHSSKLGTILAYGHKDLTVYLFEADRGPSSTCSGACAQVWPPVTGKPQAGGGAVGSDLGTIRRADGTLQVTYKGHPLYRYAKDGDDHDAYGQGLKSFGAPWYALAPSGAKVDKS